LTLLKLHRAAIDLHDIAHDGEPQPGPRLFRIEPRTAAEHAHPILGRDSRAIVFHPDFAPVWPVVRVDRYEDAATTVLGGILDEITENFLQILPLQRDKGIPVPVQIKTYVFIEPLDRAKHRLGAL